MNGINKEYSTGLAVDQETTAMEHKQRMLHPHPAELFTT